VRTATSTFAALSPICPHRGTTVQLTGSGFCWLRTARRGQGNGTCTGGQPTDNLNAVPAKYDATAGTLTIG
jgi:hypothetical protein